MDIAGTYVTRGGDLKGRKVASAIRQARRLDVVTSGRRAAREDAYRRHALEGLVQGAEAELVSLHAVAARLDADIAGMREDGAASGKINARLAVSLMELAEMPAVLRGAEQRVEAARARLDAEVAEQTTRAAAIIEKPEPESEPVTPTKGSRRQ